MMMIREMHADDLSQVLECLEPLSWIDWDNYGGSMEAFEERIVCGNVLTFVYEKDDVILGTASLILDRKLSHGGRKAATVEDVSVRFSSQGQGIGKELVQYCIDYAKALKCYKVILNCSAENKPFYEKLGFHEHELGMRLDLN